MRGRDIRQFEHEVEHAFARLNLPTASLPSTDSVEAARTRVQQEARKRSVRFRTRLAFLRYGAVAAGVALAYLGTRPYMSDGSFGRFGAEDSLAMWAEAFEESSDQLAAQVSGYPDDGLDSDDPVSLEELMSDSGT